MAAGIENKTVAIIGAGVAGLAAGQALHQSGAKVVLLEARERIGGRIWTDHNLGVPVDMGAASIHGTKGNPIRKIAKRLGIRRQKADFDSYVCFLQDGSRVEDAMIDATEKKFRKRVKKLRRAAQPDETLADTVNRTCPELLSDPLLRMQVAIELEFDVGGPLACLSATHWDDDSLFKGPDLHLPDGYDAIAAHLAEGLDIRLSQIVRAIKRSETSVRIETDGEEIEADYCICTVPIGVLKAQSIAFEPSLPAAIQSAIDAIGAGNADKVALKFDTVFWDNDAEYIGYAGDERGRYPYLLNLNTIIPGCNILVSYAVGDFGRAWQGQDDETIQADLLTMLADIYGDAVPEPHAMLISRWTQDPFSRCSYSYAALPASKADFRTLQSIVDDRLLFAGEHTSGRYRGTVHGAYLSGIRAAEAIS